MIKRIQKLLTVIVVPGYTVMALCLIYWLMLGMNVLEIRAFSVNVIIGLVFVMSAVSALTGTWLKFYYINSAQEDLDNLNELNTKLRRQRHEYLNEMQVVYGLLELGEGEEALEFLKPVYEETARTGRALKTAHPAVNALLMNKMNQAEERHIGFYIETSSNLANAAMDAWSLCKVLGNLIDNALTAAEQDEKAEVHLEIREDAAGCEICIYNNGAFIAEKDRDRIFEDGFSGKNSEGHGLGLGIVRNIVRQAGGTIEWESERGRTVFTIRIPRAVPAGE
ncbi:MAG: Spo0B domain-containing protein [Firmicutes bacterium]|nr:Spo0B domain-containing protein [Bacillota bacterium]